jgi:hypothetical protein
MRARSANGGCVLLKVCMLGSLWQMRCDGAALSWQACLGTPAAAASCTVQVQFKGAG